MYVCVSMSVSIGPSIYLGVYLSIYLSICPSMYLCIYLSLYGSIPCIGTETHAHAHINKSAHPYLLCINHCSYPDSILASMSFSTAAQSPYQ